MWCAVLPRPWYGVACPFAPPFPPTDAICACVVARQPLDQLQAWAEEAFADVRPTSPVLGPAPLFGLGDAPGPGPGPGVAVAPQAAAAAVTVPASVAPPPPAAQQPSGAIRGAAADGAPAASHVAGSGSGSSISSSTNPHVNGPGAPRRYGSLDVAGPSVLGRLFRVAPQRELRQLEVQWYLPYGSLAAAR